MLIKKEFSVFDSGDFEDKSNKIFTGFKGLDQLVGGLGCGELIVVASRPGAGKTSLLLQIAETVSLTDQVLFFTLEMGRRALARRTLKFHEQRIGRDKAIDHINNLKLFLDDSSYPSIDHICNRSANLKKSDGIKLVIVDCFQSIQETLERPEFVVRRLKNLARELYIPVLCSSNLNREIEARVSKRPFLSDLRNYGDLDQYADKVLLIYREEMYFQNTENKGKSEIICAKNNNNRVGQIEATFDPEITRFGDFDGKTMLRVVKPPKD